MSLSFHKFIDKCFVGSDPFTSFLYEFFVYILQLLAEESSLLDVLIAI